MIRFLLGTCGVFLLALSGVVACGGQPRGAVEPEHRATALLGEPSVEVISTRQNPLVVDWKNEQRADLEVAMAERLAVVRFDGRSIRLFDRCSLEGSYGFVRVTPKEQLIVLESAEEVQVNLPLAAAGLGVDLGAQFSRGSSVELGMVIVGKKSSVRAKAAPSELSGDCAGATHFVRAATIGAFALRSGSNRRASSVAELFGAGASGSTSNSKEVHISDGSAAACRAEGDASKPPARCAALLRVELVPLATGSTSEATPECARGLRWTGAKCTAAAEPIECSKSKPAECSAQCQAGNGASCTTLGTLIDGGRAGQPRDAKLAAEFYLRACDLGHLVGCAKAGSRYYYGEGFARAPQKAIELFEKSCNGGEGVGCMNLGVAYRDGTPVKRDLARAASLFKRSCDSGYPGGCSQLGAFYKSGRGGLPIDPARALALYERACSGDYADGCTNVGTMFEAGKGTLKDYARALELYTRGCKAGSASGCSNVGVWYREGRGVSKNASEANRWFERACAMYAGGSGCAALALSYERGEGVARDDAKALELLQKGCRTADGYSCEVLAERHAKGLLGLQPDPLKALELNERACGFGHGNSCMQVGLAYFWGQGVTKDSARALQFFETGCEAGSDYACFNAGVSLVDQNQAEKGARYHARACDLDNPMSCTNLGLLHENGRGVAHDQAKANQLYDKGCEGNNYVGCANLGRNYLKGRGLPVDADRGIALLNRACEGGHGKACVDLAAEHAKNPAGKIQLVAAYRKACELEQANACAMLGEIFRQGSHGVTRDPTRAVETLQTGCTHGAQQACVSLAELLSAGEGTAKNTARAAELLTVACEQKNSGAACRALSGHFARGDGVKKSAQRSLELLERACRAGDAQGCDDAGNAYEKGRGAPRNRARAAELYDSACRLGKTASCRSKSG